MHSDHKDRNWNTQYAFRTKVAGHMAVARETIAWIYGNSLDLTGFIDGTGNPEAGAPARVRHHSRRQARGGRGLLPSPSGGCTTSSISSA